MAILIRNTQSSLKIDLEKIQKTAQVVLNALAYPDDELSVLIVNDSRIEELNREYLNRQGPTNVIAFPMYDDTDAGPGFRTPGDCHIPRLLGDVVISVDTARKEGEQAGVSTERRLIQLLVHGILHLVGYDHESTEEEAIRMEAMSNELLGIIEDSEDSH
ncbi:rRNA maturation RNase YbeY [Desulfococcaceae bacterium HSG8]|nr:rRNA maturation RNase YbeY [Desulfococcaceae bacterium HSG8]